MITYYNMLSYGNMLICGGGSAPHPRTPLTLKEAVNWLHSEVDTLNNKYAQSALLINIGALVYIIYMHLYKE